MRILTWNLAWATFSSRKGKEIVRRVREVRPNLAIFTEVTTSLIETLGGGAAYSGADYGYDAKPNRRKVCLWSPNRITNIDSLGSPALPPGRFIAADIEDIRVIGVCIPWQDAHVRSGRRNAVRWEEHMRYVEALQCLVNPLDSNTILGGDFNQRRPRYGQPEHVFSALDTALAHMTWATSGSIGPSGEQSIDHIVVTPDFQAHFADIISNDFGATKLSDHFGVCCEINRTA